MSHVYQLATSLHDQAGNFFQNVFAYELSEGGAATAFGYADALIDRWRIANMPDYLDCFGADVVLDFISAKRITGLGGPSAQQIVQSGGTQAQASISAGLAADIAWQSASPLNRAGHTFMCCGPSGGIIGDAIGVGYAAVLQTFITDQLTQLALAGGLGNADFGLFSRSTTQFNKIDIGQIKPKLTMLNKRTLPQV